MQSTIARLYYQSAAEGKWGERAWVLARLADPEAQQDVLAHVSHWRLSKPLRFSEPWRFSACASALGWAEYLREAYGCGTAPSDVELTKVYQRLAAGRVAIADLARIAYWPHDARKLVECARRKHTVDLPLILEDEALLTAKRHSEKGSESAQSKRRALPDRALDVRGTSLAG